MFLHGASDGPRWRQDGHEMAVRWLTGEGEKERNRDREKDLGVRSYGLRVES